MIGRFFLFVKDNFHFLQREQAMPSTDVTFAFVYMMPFILLITDSDFYDVTPVSLSHSGAGEIPSSPLTPKQALLFDTGSLLLLFHRHERHRVLQN